MWVLFVVILGAPQPVTMHDFDDRTACTLAADLARTATKGQAITYCVEREHSLLGPHDTLPQP